MELWVIGVVSFVIVTIIFWPVIKGSPGPRLSGFDASNAAIAGSVCFD